MKNDLFAFKWNMKVFVGPLYMEKSTVVLGKRLAIPAQLSLESIFMRKKVTLLPKVKSIYACHDCFVLTELTWLREPECLFGEKLAQLGWWPTVLDKSPWNNESITVIYSMCITRTLCSKKQCCQFTNPYPLPLPHPIQCWKIKGIVPWRFQHYPWDGGKGGRDVQC